LGRDGALRHLVCAVVCVCAQAQVSLVTAGWIVTHKVTDQLAFGDRTVDQRPRKTMGPDHLSANVDRPVALTGAITLPFKAAVRLPL